jgi:hypothetical protein
MPRFAETTIFLVNEVEIPQLWEAVFDLGEEVGKI